MALRPGLVLALALACLNATRADEGVRRDGTRVRGTLTFTDGRFAFGDEPIAGLDLVRLNPRPPADPPGPLWHAVRLGGGQIVHAGVQSLDPTHLGVRPPWAELLTIPRPAVERVTHFPGWRPVLFDSFDGDLSGWTISGAPRTAGGRLVLDRPGQSVAVTWSQPLAAGRVDVGFGAAVNTRRLVVELPFARAGRAADVRIELLGPGERFAVTSPTKASHEGRLKREAGPQRLAVEFDRDRLHVFVGDRVLWSQDAGPGELGGLRFVTDGDGTETAAVDDVLVARPGAAGEPRPWADLTADAVRSPTGDETFGNLIAAAPAGVTLEVRKKALALRWTEVGEFTFRRSAVAERATAEEHVSLRVRSIDGARDVLDGAVTAFDGRRLVLAHAVLGDLTIPRDRVEEIRFQFRGRRVPVDATPRHLGARPAFGFAVPRPEGLQFTRSITVDPVPTAGFVVVDAAGVSGTGMPVEVRVNGESVGELNRFADRPTAEVRSYRLPVPAAAWRSTNEIEIRLRPGKVGGHATGIDLRGIRLEVSP